MGEPGLFQPTLWQLFVVVLATAYTGGGPPRIAEWQRHPDYDLPQPARLPSLLLASHDEEPL
ncbi:MAG: hypothetical protein ACYCST_16530 [Acidimicrobiales bacterium]